jgi:hypothetical protein
LCDQFVSAQRQYQLTLPQYCANLRPRFVFQFLSKHLSPGSTEKKTDATAAICEDTAVLASSFQTEVNFLHAGSRSFL